MRKISSHYVYVDSQYRKYAIITIKGAFVEVGESNTFYKEESEIEFYSGTLVVVDNGEKKEIFHFKEINLQRQSFNLSEGIKIL